MHVSHAVVIFMIVTMSCRAADPPVDAAAPARPVTMTTQEDHREMLAQLGITRLRPGPSGNESAPNHANYDEALANPFPQLPELLTLRDGTSVITADDWWQKRRPEIVEDFEREVYGRVPRNVPAVTWTVAETREVQVGEVAVIEKQLRGRVDNSRCPTIEVAISMTLGTPKAADKPVPVLMMFGGFGLGRPGFRPPGPSRTELLIQKGWGYAMISPQSIQADNGQGLTRGIIGLTNLGQPRKPEDWGSLRAWAWGASRGLDALETDPAVDAKRVGIEGVSRYGKAALVAMAFEPRFAAVLVGSSGEGGAKLHRRNFGEAVENLTGSGEYHWMAGNFLKYGAAEATFGSRNAGDLPVDSHQLIALCAPRPTFISYGVPEKGDAKWLDQRGSFMAAIAAGPAFRLLGAKDLGRSDNYNSEQLPSVNEGLLDGALAWRQHDGGHTDTPNLPYFIDWANRLLAQDAPENNPARRGRSLAPTQANVKYGAHDRNVLDFYQAKSERPAPLVVFIHGGGFRAGDKSSLNAQIAASCLANGVSVAAINYRLRPPTPIQDILRDCARAIQFLRFKASELNLDKTRVAAFGGSAGAGTSLWLAFHDDLADPASDDPVLRESTRLTCAGATSCQFTYDILAWREVFGEAVDKFDSGDSPATFYGLADDAELRSPKGEKIRADCDMRGLISRDDPPVFLSTAQPGGEVANRGHLLHHPKHAEAIQIRCRECGVPAIANLPGLKIAPAEDEPQDLAAFLLKQLGVRKAAGT